MFVFVLSGLAVVVSIFVVLGPIVWDVVTRFVPLSPGTRAAWFLVRYLLATAGMVVALLLLHHYLPNRPQGWRRIMPGILFTVVALLLGATGFSVYLSYAGNYSITYGGLASVVVSLMFFYVASAIFIFGAYLNRAIERQRQKEESKKRRAEAASRTSSPGTGEAAQLQA